MIIIIIIIPFGVTGITVTIYINEYLLFSLEWKWNEVIYVIQGYTGSDRKSSY